MFRSEDGARRLAEHQIPFGADFQGHPAAVVCSVVLGSCPPPSSRQECVNVGMRIDTARPSVDVGRLDERGYSVVRPPGGHCLLRVPLARPPQVADLGRAAVMGDIPIHNDEDRGSDEDENDVGSKTGGS